MDTLNEYAETYGIKEIINDLGSYMKTDDHHIIFPNGWVALIVDGVEYPRRHRNKKYSVSVYDYRTHFDHDILNEYGADNGNFYCKTEKEVIRVCEIIRNIESEYQHVYKSWLSMCTSEHLGIPVGYIPER